MRGLRILDQIIFKTLAGPVFGNIAVFSKYIVDNVSNTIIAGIVNYLAILILI